jgi:hypothetical protein
MGIERKQTVVINCKKESQHWHEVTDEIEITSVKRAGNLAELRVRTSGCHQICSTVRLLPFVTSHRRGWGDRQRL